MTQRQYIEYLIATPGNYTCTNLADHLEGEAAQSHDAISDFLRQEKLTPRRVPSGRVGRGGAVAARWPHQLSNLR